MFCLSLWPLSLLQARLGFCIAVARLGFHNPCSLQQVVVYLGRECKHTLVYLTSGQVYTTFAVARGRGDDVTMIWCGMCTLPPSCFMPTIATSVGGLCLHPGFPMLTHQARLGHNIQHDSASLQPLLACAVQLTTAAASPFSVTCCR